MNEVLLKPDQWIQARKLINNAGLKPHPDNPKNWDHFLALESILRYVDQAEPVLDAGGYAGTFGTWLKQLGYQDVTVLNKTFETDQDKTEEGVKLMTGDITKTIIPTGTMGCVTCMSVIEHGVDHEKFLKECYRIIKPGGRLIVSTDYWAEKINTADKHDDLYKCPVIVYSAAEIKEFVELATKSGFRSSSVPMYDCADTCVTWERMGLRYTFIILELVRDLADG
ncbi:MAG: methyltransferase domain-containing protein [Candidatus Thorarchaeota archaeon]|jgi:2-polyprenyl-3-methyl-5-hydroxy-6-metoxy-1,4-benzoquinol methylase